MTNQIKVLALSTFAIFIIDFCQAQIDSTGIRNVISFTPTKVKRVNGLAVGLWNKPQYHKQTINGINIELVGSGLMTSFLGLDDGGYLLKTKNSQTINGICLGLTLFNGNVNGLSISPLINTTYSLKGIKFGLITVDLNDARGLQIGILNINKLTYGGTIGFYNNSYEVHGFQIGLINRTKKLRGIQVGLININRSRTMILFNWPSNGD